MKIGFIGLGIMGKPMAHNLIKAGHCVHVYARRPAATQDLITLGALACTSPMEIAEETALTFVMVSDTPDVEQVLFAENGYIAGARAGSIVVDMGTSSPIGTRVIAQKLASCGVDMLDAPVSGGDSGAINGTLSIMVGGKAEIFQRVKPYFACLGKTIIHVGDHGAGQVAKACNQIVAAATIEAVAEAFIFAKKIGVDPAKVRDALLGGFAYSKVLELHGKRMLEHDFKPGFKAELHQKDLRIVMGVAHELGLALPAAAFAAEQLDTLVAGGDGELDSSAIFKIVEKANK